MGEGWSGRLGEGSNETGYLYWGSKLAGGRGKTWSSERRGNDGGTERGGHKTNIKNRPLNRKIMSNNFGEPLGDWKTHSSKRTPRPLNAHAALPVSPTFEDEKSNGQTKNQLGKNFKKRLQV